MLDAVRVANRRPVILMYRAHLHAGQRRAIDAIVEMFPAAIVVSTGEPFDLAGAGAAQILAASYGNDEAALAGLGRRPLRARAGSRATSGRLVSAAAIDRVLDAACSHAFTAAVARVERCGVLVYERAVGVTRADRDAAPVYVDSQFDLASLTKLFVSTLALDTVARGELTLDESLSQWIPAWRSGGHAAITLRMLLSHTSGMHSGADYRTLLDRNVADFALERPLRCAPGSQVDL